VASTENGGALLRTEDRAGPHGLASSRPRRRPDARNYS
jgi:hypothetical protein